MFKTILMLVAALVALPPAGARSAGHSLRFFGNGVDDIDRVKIRIDDPETQLPGPPADVGATDFTLEFWMRATAGENPAPPVSCGWNIEWIYGNIVFDRDRFSQDRKFGLSIAGGVLVWGVTGEATGDRTICGATGVLDGRWHHVAVQRRRVDGWMWLFVDGVLESAGDGPDGDVSYPDDGVPGNHCGGPCVNSDPFLVIGAEKHDAGPAFPSYSGWVDEVRLSVTLRYTTDFTPPAQPFAADAATVALYHLDAGQGDDIVDSSGHPDGPSPGVRRFGGSPAGPLWSTATPFEDPTGIADGAVDPAAPFAGASLIVTPHPVHSHATLRARAPGGLDGPATATIHDVSGRRVAALAGLFREGTAVLEWNVPRRGRDGLAAGVYFVRLPAGREILVRAVVVR